MDGLVVGLIVGLDPESPFVVEYQRLVGPWDLLINPGEKGRSC